MPSEILQLSADDLMAPLPEHPRLGGPGPFVINLSASPSPIEGLDRAIAGGGRAHAYQLKRIEDRRIRYRLRLGPFATEDQALAALAVVRQSYPAALTATADADDLRAIAGLEAKANARPPAQKTPASARAEPVKPARAEPTKAPQRRVEPRPQAPPPRAANPHISRERTTGAKSTGVKNAVASADNGAAPWYVVELAAAQKPFTPAELPPLDVLSLYRLYSLAGMDKGRTMYVLRLGFFSDEAAAATIAKYLGAHFDAPTVKRVSVAERERFAVQRPKTTGPAAVAVKPPVTR